MKLRSIAASFCLVLACSSSSAPTSERATLPVVEQAAAPADDATRIATWRAEGPAALERLLADYDQLTPGVDRVRMAATIDKVAGQRYATWSRLYWYDDLGAAKAAARASGKPILSLRMLGRLDEDLSCANSRFFRTTLYPDAAVAKLLREEFVLHVSSERDVPRITVDYGDGRTLQSTITGNSAHYILDAEGRPLDVLPGLYSPQVFRQELGATLAMYGAIKGTVGRERDAALLAYHQAAAQGAMERWQQMPLAQGDNGKIRWLSKDEIGKRRVAAAVAAQRVTVSKAMVEVPMMRTVDLGVDPGTIPDDTGLWVDIYNEMWKAKGRRVLDNNARALVDSMLTVDRDARARILVGLEKTIAADTAINESRLRPQIRAYFVQQLAGGAAAPGFAELNTWVYANVFHAPATDQWMGLLPTDTFTGLPGGAVIATKAD
ncbi:MAG TPA: hypothetical protein VM261_22715 [Kofleriaceae bacterium]|nr:hypothetical protein [Kofleriaceae bacterium]